MKTKTFRNVLCAAMTGCALLNPLHTTTTMAQKQFTLEDLNFGGTNYRNMVPENRYTTWWGDRLVRTEVDYCAEVNLKNGKETRLFSLDEINEWAGLKGSDEKIRHFYSASFPYADKSLVMVMNGRENLLVDFKKHTLVKRWNREQQTQALERNKQSDATAYVKGDQLYVTTTDGQTHQLTKDGSREIVYGQSVHRDEFGISGGLYWSPKGNRLAFYRMDQSMVSDYPLPDIPELNWTPKPGESRAAKLDMIKYPMAGDLAQSNCGSL